MAIEQELKQLQKDYAELWKWTSNLASIVQCLIEDRMDDESISEEEKEHYCKLLKEI